MKNNGSRNMKRQLYLFAFFMVLFSIVCISLITYFKSIDEQRQKIYENNQQIIEQLSYNLDSYFDDLARLSLVPAYNKSLISILEEAPAMEDDPLMQLEKQRYIENFLDSIMVYPRKDILHAFVVADKIYYGSRYRPGFDNSVTLEGLQLDYNKLPQDGATVFTGPYITTLKSSPVKEVFSVYNVVRSTKADRNVLAIIKVDADFSTINKTCSTIEIGKNSGLVILNNEGKQAYSSVSDEVSAALAENTGNISANREAVLAGEKYLINSVPITKPNWRIYCLTSFKDINAEALSTRNLTLAIAFFLAAFAFIVIFVFMNRFLSPLYEIMEKIKEVGRGHFNVTFPAARLDEVGMLGASMNEVVSQLDFIMEENSALSNRMLHSQLIEKEAQVNMLYSQIQPHFIYNTLNMISISVQIGNSDEAVLMINKLSKLMRSMSKSDSIHSLGSELELLRDYLDIQERRYGDRLEYKITVDDGIEDVKIPTLLLQPIAENAVVHGCEHGRTKTIIDISATADEDCVNIKIHDNGRGMDSITLSNIKEKVERTASESSDSSFKQGGTGLRNVNQRLKIRYGSEYGINIESTPDEGTTVTLKVPY